MKFYLSHPRNLGDLGQNLKDADLIAKRLNLDLIEPFKLIPQDGSISEEEAMKRCIELLLQADGIILSGDYLKSNGCLLEQAIAKAIGLPVLIYKGV